MNEIKKSIRLPEKDSKKWELYHNIGELVKQMNHLPDAQEIRKNKPRTVPAALLEMIF